MLMRRRLPTLHVLLAASLGTIISSSLLYARAFDGFFIYDDFAWLGCALDSQSSLLHIFNLHISNFFRPLAHLYFAALYALCGPSPFAFHLGSLALHVVNVVLMAALVLRLTRLPWLTFFSTLLFACMPVYNEALGWVSGVTEPVATLPVLLTLLSFRRYLEGGPRGRAASYALVALSFALALLAKESSVSLLPLLALLHLGLRHLGRARPVGLLPYLPLGILLLAYLLGQHRIQQENYLVKLRIFSIGPHALLTVGNSLAHLARRSWPVLVAPLLLALLTPPSVARIRAHLGLAALFVLALLVAMLPYAMFAGRLLASRYFYLPSMIFAVGTALLYRSAFVDGGRILKQVVPPLALSALVLVATDALPPSLGSYLAASRRTGRFVHALEQLPPAGPGPVAVAGSLLKGQHLEDAMRLFYRRAGYASVEVGEIRASRGVYSSAWFWDEATARFHEINIPRPRPL
jgi:hypothetical protein